VVVVEEEGRKRNGFIMIIISTRSLPGLRPRPVGAFHPDDPKGAGHQASHHDYSLLSANEGF